MSAQTLAGTNGIPLSDQRVYLRVIAETDESGYMRPTEIVWPDGRRFSVASTTLVRTLGRWERGNLTYAYELVFKRRNGTEVRRDVWWERGRWFCRKA